MNAAINAGGINPEAAPTIAIVRGTRPSGRRGRIVIHEGAAARFCGKPFGKCRRNRSPHGGRILGNRIEVVARQAHDNSVSDGSDGCRSIAACEERDLANRRTARDFGDGACVAFDFDRKAAGYDDIKGVRSFALLHDIVAAMNVNRLQAVFEKLKGVSWKILEGGDARERKPLSRHWGAAWRDFSVLIPCDAPRDLNAALRNAKRD